MGTERQQTVTLEVFRYRPEENAESTFQRYEVSFRPHWVVLDALNHIKDHVDGTLSYRWSCRMGICGSCGMMVDGKPALTCSVFLRDYDRRVLRIEPLAHFPVIRDLVIDMEDFLEKMIDAKTWLIHSDGKEIPEETERECRQTPAQLARYQRFSMCINCMLCYSACPVYGQDQAFLGPAAIALAQRYNLDSRDAGRDERAEMVFSHEGIWGCTFVGDCTRVCPKNVDPAGAIQQAKLSAMLDWYRSLLMPKKSREGDRLSDGQAEVQHGPAATKVTTGSSVHRKDAKGAEKPRTLTTQVPTYRRPVPANWWLEREPYRWYMLRESTSLFVTLYALFLLVLLAVGLETFEAVLTNPVVVALHLPVWMMVTYHSLTWFRLVPQVIVLWWGKKRISPWLVAAAHYAAWGAISVAVILIAKVSSGG